MEAQRDTIVVLSGTGENDAINGLMTSLADLIRSQGRQVAYFDLAKFPPAESKRFFECFASGRVLFGLTYLGIGQSLEVETKKSGNQNIWEFFNVPLLKLHGDIPAYFLERHRDLPRNSVNLYGGQEFLDFQRAVLPQGTSLSMRFDPWLISDVPEADIDFSARAKGRLHFIKNGGNPAALEALWRERLPAALVQQLLELSREVVAKGLRPGKLDLHALVQSYLAERRIDLGADAELYCFFAAQLDDYLRRVKSTLIAQALLACPVVIQGSNWGHLDTAGAVATLVPAQSFEVTEALFRTQLGVIDMSPNLDTTCHDRMMRAAGMRAFALTNQSSWLEDLLPGLQAVAFTFEPDGIRAAVDAALRQPDACLELGRAYGRAFRERYPAETFFERLTTVAEMARLRHASPKPPLQPYLVW